MATVSWGTPPPSSPYGLTCPAFLTGLPAGVLCGQCSSMGLVSACGDCFGPRAAAPSEPLALCDGATGVPAYGRGWGPDRAPRCLSH